jgi:hypothetical protein
MLVLALFSCVWFFWQCLFLVKRAATQAEAERLDRQLRTGQQLHCTALVGGTGVHFAGWGGSLLVVLLRMPDGVVGDSHWAAATLHCPGGQDRYGQALRVQG